MSHIHIHAPIATFRMLYRDACPTCKRRTFFIRFYTPYYGPDDTCLKCGDSWGEEGVMAERPFERVWRKKAIAAVKKRWRAWNQAAVDRAKSELYGELGS